MEKPRTLVGALGLSPYSGWSQAWGVFATLVASSLSELFTLATIRATAVTATAATAVRFVILFKSDLLGTVTGTSVVLNWASDMMFLSVDGVLLKDV